MTHPITTQHSRTAARRTRRLDRCEALILCALTMSLNACSTGAVGEELREPGTDPDVSADDILPPDGGSMDPDDDPMDDDDSELDPDSGVPLPVEPGCGDGITQEGEFCDDGNEVGDDGCSADCTTAHCLVPVTHATLQAALDDAQCPAVHASAGTYDVNLTIARAVTLVGLGDRGAILDGGKRSSVITVSGAHAVTLKNLAIKHGHAVSRGGGVGFAGAQLTIDDCLIERNESGYYGAGIGGYSGSLTVRDSEVRANRAISAPGDVASGGGIGVFNVTVDIRGTRIAENEAIHDDTIMAALTETAYGGGLYVHQASATAGTASVRIEDSVIDENRTHLKSGAPVGSGGGIFLREVSRLRIRNSSVTNNSASFGGGLSAWSDARAAEGAAPAFALTQTTFAGNHTTGSGAGAVIAASPALGYTVVAKSLTVAGNDATAGTGGLYAPASSPLQLANSIIAGNTGTTANCSTGAFTSGGYNLLGAGCSPVSLGATDLTPVEPALDALAMLSQHSYGRLPLAESLAVNAGDPAGCSDENGALLTHDQRGQERAGVCDIGAIERP